ncbi:hypothetical protein [Bradyrhizobium sp. Gha]|uniref:hypothetical protein n=1 Tax=Bradyrhizobium sp. Gha TaxID=1855318 RepID=UPI00116023DE|nr:hypothetical protein [Bradyrhizobium sp. Gha]
MIIFVIFAFQLSELALALLLVCGIFVTSGSPVAVIAMLAALGMNHGRGDPADQIEARRISPVRRLPGGQADTHIN